jgi:hypothetical protein
MQALEQIRRFNPLQSTYVKPQKVDFIKENINNIKDRRHSKTSQNRGDPFFIKGVKETGKTIQG